MERPIDKAKRDASGRFVNEPGSMADSPICVKFTTDVDEILRSLPNRSEKIRQWVIEGLEREGLLPPGEP
ncbi:hypothetical protein VF14_08910 [Nostoc linckia z18]|uniref:Uncharacterized protein n=2 Tax=Nostoc linckia TaxID=92942 RepID=A0A9Q5ZEB3_NOSLI|nr:hypothetical protein [Nostoc linckia]PHK25377.1 hypothetical protein VF10_07865 [Nostoc linckia z13]PHK35765.1 hypothetical protein VF14_08910 [Nostoc linckia z18]PHK42563.1 hypothetical protein VF12_02555 [Nostoc linckia z15]PHK44539.1 hypothetical protein VF13_21260 [Nostoc linckia z16]PHJ59583.1 hypothetical protein VF02_24535 [Nostoc linckia z1]